MSSLSAVVPSGGYPSAYHFSKPLIVRIACAHSSVENQEIDQHFRFHHENFPQKRVCLIDCPINAPSSPPPPSSPMSSSSSLPSPYLYIPSRKTPNKHLPSQPVSPCHPPRPASTQKSPQIKTPAYRSFPLRSLPSSTKFRILRSRFLCLCRDHLFGITA